MIDSSPWYHPLNKRTLTQVTYTLEQCNHCQGTPPTPILQSSQNIHQPPTTHLTRAKGEGGEGLLSLLSKKKNRDEQEYCLLIKRRNRFLLPSSMVVRLHKKCTYSGLIFSVAFVACACAGYLSKSCSLQVQDCR